MTGVILAAGEGSRLRPLTDTHPKCLLPIGGRTILSRTLENLISNDLSNLVIVTGYRADQIRGYIGSAFQGLSVRFLHNDVYASTNNIYSLWLARHAVQGDEVLLLDSDIMFDAGIIGLLAGSGHQSCLAVTSQHALGEEEIKVRLAADRSILAIGKDVPPLEAAGESIGIEKFDPGTFARLAAILDTMIAEEGRVNVFYEAAFQMLIGGGTKLFAVEVGPRPCIEIDTHQDIALAEKLVEAGAL